MKTIRLMCAASVFATAALAWTGSAAAHGIVVKPGQSIQAAVDAASPGDTIFVKGGVYRESVLIMKDGLRLVGLGARIEPPDPAVASFCADPAHPDETIGICVFGDIFSDPEHPDYTEDVDVQGFRVRGFDSGIVTVGARDAELEWNRAADNHVFGFVTVLSPGTRIHGNVAARNGVAGIFALDQPEGGLSIAHNRVRRNGMGVYLVGVAGGKVAHNRIAGNAGGGIVLEHSSAVVVRGNRLRNNDPDLFWDSFGLGNAFRHNDCETSTPDGLCD